MTPITIGQLGRKVGLRPSAIRYYEAQGVVGSPGRSANGYRVYGPEAVVLLQFICRSKELGFTLDEIRQLIETSRNGPPCTLTRKLIERHLGAVEDEIRRLNSLRHRLKRAMHQPAPGEGANGLCSLIESSQQ